MAPLPRDHDKLFRMEQAVRVLLYGLGEDLNREGLRDTPKRVAKALLDCTQGYHQDTSSTLGTALFHEPIVHQGGEGTVIVRDIDFASTSEETLLPFHGRCHVAYRPTDGVVLGLSKLARLTKQYAKRLQTQERLAAAIALALQQSLQCYGVAVVLQARHLSSTAMPEERTNACVSGVFAAGGSAELEELLALLDLEDLPEAAIAKLDCGAITQEMDAAEAGTAATLATDPGVPVPGTPDHREEQGGTDGDSDDLVLEARFCSEEMEAAVQQLLVELGENPHRAGLVGSARRYVMSLLASTSGYHMQLPPAYQLCEPAQGGLLRPPPQPQPQPRAQGLLQQQRQQQQQAYGQGVHCGQGIHGVAGGWTASGAGVPGRHAAEVAVNGHRGGCANGVVASVSTCHLNGARVARSCCNCLASSATACFARSGRCQLQQRCAPAAAAVRMGEGAVATSGPLRGAVTLCLPFTSQCEHHMLPFYGEIMVAYHPGGPVGCQGPAVLPHAAIEQVVCMYTQRLQVQERITHQVADAVEAMLRNATGAAAQQRSPPAAGYTCNGSSGNGNGVLPCSGGAGRGYALEGTAGLEGDSVARREEAAAEQPVGVMVVCDAAHMCMVARGVENHSGSTTTFAVRGSFEALPEMRRAVLRLFRERSRA